MTSTHDESPVPPADAVSDGPRRRRDRREDLLAAAARCFVANGIRRTTMEDVAQQARAGKATLYRHFANKDALIDALLEREADRLDRRLRAAVDDHDDAPGRIEAAFVAGVTFFVTHPVMTRGRDEEPGILLPRITANGGPLVGRGLELFTDLLACGVASGELRRVDPPAGAEVIMRLMLSYFSIPPLHVRVDDEDEARAFAHALVAGGFRAR
ncbi:TetR/AcrR family transcriptional regulator [Egicoccus halophilus]|uniref:TetR family transcriptional regulator n=1 Tax=Egicoccus halophilus TaxID=1670830 RepID=A0A8J3AB43_9ACTN|nr:TetR/AcrR family transcriptional regulator [Egicoccus halophilus]GGI07251.1 TetR family transcriptional regulator [Egicoccus halophilus]